MSRIFAKHPGMLVGMLLSVGLLGAFWASLSSPAFIAHEGSMLRLPLLSWWRNVPLIFSRDFTMFTDGQFRPLSYVLLAVVRTFVGAENAVFWHLWMLAFHALNAILVFVLVRHFSEHLWSAGVASAIFAFHPLSSVVVNNVNYFHYVLGLTFYLGTFCCYLTYERGLRKRVYVAALVLFILGLLTSKVLLTLPLVLVVYEAVFRRSGFREAVRRLMPFGICCLLLSPFYLFYTPPPLQYKYAAFPPGAGWYSFFSAVGATGRYARGLLLGWDLPVPLHETLDRIFRFSHPRFLLWALVNLGVLLAGGWMVLRRRWAGLGVFLFFGSLLPFVSMLWNRVEAYVAWPYLYFPLVGFAFFLGGIADRGSRGFQSEIRNPKSEISPPRTTHHAPRGSWWLGVFVAILCLYYGIQQVRLNLASRSPMAYWSRVIQINPNSERAAMELGASYLQRGEQEQALRVLFSPARKQLHAPCLVMSRYYCAQGDYLAAAVHLRMARHEESGLQFQTNRWTKAELFYAAGAPEYAQEAFGAVLTANPYHIGAMERLAEIWMGKGYVAAAVRLLERAEEIAPSHPAVARMRTKSEAKRSRLIASEAPPVIQPPDPAWLQYVTREGYHPPPIETVLRLSETHPDDPVIHLETGIALIRKDRPDRALSELRFAVASLPSCAYVWAIKCLAASQAGAYKEAMDAGLRANELDPASGTVHATLGILFGKRADTRPEGPERRKDLDEAIGHLQFVLNLDSGNAVIHKTLGKLLISRRRLGEGIGHFRQALQLKPSFASAHYELGKALAALGKFEEAVEQYRQALRFQPGQAEVHDDLGIALVQQKKFEEAVGHFRQAVRLLPTYERAHANLSKVLMSQGRFKEAIAALGQALNNLPDDLNLSITLSWLLATCSDPDLRNGALAAQLAERVCRKTGYRYPKPLDVLAAAYAEMGRYDAAVQQARHALQLALSSGQSELGEQIAARLKLYKAHLVDSAQ